MPRTSQDDPLRMMAVLAHPDDETLGMGGTLARYADEGVRTSVITATRGESGRHGGGEHPGREALGRIREGELRAAARELGVDEVRFLDYVDGRLDRADPREAVGRIVRHIRRVRPHVVVTFGYDGAYGHPDHVAISQLATTAAACAADPGFEAEAEPDAEADPDPDRRNAPWRVAKLYWIAWGPDAWETYQRTFKKLVSVVDGVERQANPWPEWAITTRVDARRWWPVVWRAVQRHRTQMEIYGALADLPDEVHERLWGDQTFYRVFSTVNGGRETEIDLFEGLRAGDGVGGTR